MAYRLEYDAWYWKLLEENTSKTPSDVNWAGVFFGQSPKTIEVKAKFSKWDLIKLISFCIAKETKTQTERQPMDWEKIFSNDATNQGLIPKICRQLAQPHNRKTKPNQKMGRRPKYTFLQRRESLDHWKSKRVPEKHLLLLYWLRQSLWQCGSQQTVENSSRDGNTRPPDLPPEKSVCRSRSNS